MKNLRTYSAPSLKSLKIGPLRELLTTSIDSGTWENSISDTGSDWGGTDVDDSLYGL